MCPEALAFLRQRFPDATIVPGDVRDPRVQHDVLSACAAKGGATIATAGIPCQPGSSAATVHHADDPRIVVGQKAVELLCRSQPRLLVIEDVPGFKTNQRKAYDDVMTAVKKAFKCVETRTLGTFHCLLPTGRNRLFIVGATSQRVMAAFTRTVHQQKLAVKAGKRTEPTPLELLKPYGIPRGVKGVFYNHMRYAKIFKGAGPPSTRAQRIHSLKQRLPTVTSNLGRVTVEQLRRYVPNKLDAAQPSQTMVLSGGQIGVINGFPMDTEWSKARRCLCDGCTGLNGKCRGETAALQRANLLTQHQATVVLKGPVQAIADENELHAVAKAARAAKDQLEHKLASASAAAVAAHAKWAATRADQVAHLTDNPIGDGRPKMCNHNTYYDPIVFGKGKPHTHPFLLAAGVTEQNGTAQEPSAGDAQSSLRRLLRGAARNSLRRQLRRLVTRVVPSTTDKTNLETAKDAADSREASTSAATCAPSTSASQWADPAASKRRLCHMLRMDSVHAELLAANCKKCAEDLRLGVPPVSVAAPRRTNSNVDVLHTNLGGARIAEWTAALAAISAAGAAAQLADAAMRVCATSAAAASKARLQQVQWEASAVAVVAARAAV